MTKNTFYENAEVFLKKLDAALKKQQITLDPQWDIDHLCYRTTSDQNYTELKRHLIDFSQLLIESEVNGRMISTFELNQPLEFLGRKIALVELPAPKPGKVTPEGFEHIEIVCDIPFDEIEKRWPDQKYDRKGLKKNFNKELELELGEMNIKFHHLSLRSVIELESNTKVWSALQNSKVLEVLAPFDPLVAGTFPLGIHTKKSDLDIVVMGQNLNEVRDLIKAQKAWGDIEIKRYRVNDLETLLINFTFEDVPFEIFSQGRPPVKQQAYRHFLIEERLLKYYGPKLTDRIRDLRRQGLKTEPAFALTLGLENDPYKDLLLLEKLAPESILKSFNAAI
jgi:uncharacterized protein